ncbi:MAG TPA: GNAT family N-acetyltransferase [candidate division Zixibacteria bacterium]|nr:GNAT family N-acetyltransferase [candidate division Zixibacteria bacterium]
MFVSLNTDLLKFRLVEEPLIDADWFVRHLATVMAHDPDGCFALMVQNEPVGMITATAYGNIGWLGWLYVKVTQRDKGLGEQLMRRGVEYLHDAGCRTILLEAVLKAVPLYERIGFKPLYPTRHWLIQPSEPFSVDCPNLTVECYRSECLDDLTAFDTPRFGANRRDMIELASHNPSFTGFIARYENEICGYLFTTRTTTNRQAGPLLAGAVPERAAIVTALINAAFEQDDLPLYIRCPEVDSARAGIIRALGAKSGPEYTMRMFLGEPCPPAPPDILSLGSPGKG